MKRLSFLFAALLSLGAFGQNAGKIQIAILFDTSNSMDGLIDQAKSRIWSIVNTMSNLRYQGQIPTIEIALYDYGNDNIPAANNHVRQILPFTRDLDLVSQKLFGLTTRGGQEYCGAVISNSLVELGWNNYSNDIKMIYIAGNEPFNQGPVPYKEVCAQAAQRNIYVNTIYCGDYQQGITEFWYDGAQSGKGEYSNINSNLQVRHYDTPYDEKIRVYNDSLNGTYMGYGNAGRSKKEAQEKEDKNAVSQSVHVMTERAIVKSKAVYNNASWDLLDAYKADSTVVTQLKDDQLPEELKGKNESEIKTYLDIQHEKREKYQKMIGELSVERENYINEQKKNEPAEADSDFGKEIEKNVLKVANEKGFEVEKK